MVSRAVIGASNALLRARKPKCRAAEMIVLIPSCLQSSKCTNKVTVDIANCKRCGGCRVGDIIQVAEEYGVKVACATGGELALSLVKDDSVKVIIALACEKELRAGIIGAFPKPVCAIVNSRPNGPCRDTVVDIGDVRAAIERFLKA